MSKEHVIEAQLPGIFYRRPSPDAEPFAKEGDHVEEGAAIGLIELMKSYHEVVASATGTVSKFLAKNEAEVEVGTNLAIITPE